MKWLISLMFFILIVPVYAIPNPASTYCVHHGGQSVIRKSKQGWVGYCLFSDHSYCEEWEYFRKKCTPGEKFLTEYKKKCKTG